MLLHGDCLELMGGIAPGSVDMILADLPYGTTACKWDTVIPFEPLWAHYKRLIKKNGAIVLTASQPFTSALVMSNPGWFKYSLVWQKNRLTNFFNTPYQPGKAHEDIIIFSPAAASYTRTGTNMTYNPQKLPGAAWVKRDTGNLNNHVFHAPKRAGLRGSEGRQPLSVLSFDVVQRTTHGTQKPVALMEYLIRTYTNEGETVLDNTMGSGTTGVACVNTGREFIGIEKDAAYFAIAEQRIAKAQADRAELLVA
jgi:site-specific DNA-methyltransferase (adenine-specific)